MEGTGQVGRPVPIGMEIRDWRMEMGRIVCASIGGFVAGVVATVIVLQYHYGLVDRVEAGLFAIQNRVCGRPEWMEPEEDEG